MPDISSWGKPHPYHILSYGTLLGSQMFQSFVGGIVAYRALPRPQFSSLQQAIFPVYFAMQTSLPVLLALTYPGEGSTSSSLAGVLAERNRLSTFWPILTMFSTGLANLVFVGPETTKIMRQRKVQETRDGKKSYDAPPHSKEMISLNKRFGRMHGISSLVNMIGLLATVWYGATLSDRLQ